MSPRYFETVPDSDEDIIEEVNYLRKTKKGMKTTTKRVPMTHPPQAKAGMLHGLGTRVRGIHRSTGPKILHRKAPTSGIWIPMNL